MSPSVLGSRVSFKRTAQSHLELSPKDDPTEWLRAIEQWIVATDSLLLTIKANANSSKAHWQLVRKFIIQFSKDQSGYRGTSGEAVDWLKTLDKQRRSSDEIDALKALHEQLTDEVMRAKS